jgi:LacI family transcriptional regulator
MRATLTNQVRETIKQQVYSGLRPGTRIPTEEELSSIHSVSVTTIRRAIDGLVADGLLVRRQGSGTYVTDRRKARNQTVGLVIPDSKFSPFYGRMAAGLTPLLQSHGYSSMLFVAEDIDSLHQAIRSAKKRLDGVIVCGYLIRHEELREERIPYVIAGSEGRIDADCVCFDLSAGTRNAVGHLVELGHREILFLSNLSAEGFEHPKFDMDRPIESNPRFVGYKEALERAGISVRNELVVRAGPSRLSGYQTMKRFLSEGVCFSAVFAGNDQIAEGAAQAMREAGIEIPEKVSLIGCDNIQDASDRLIALTTIDLRLEDVARRSVELLMDRIERPLANEYRCISLVPQLVPRGTTGPAPVG